jgi:hypothetical protein
MRAREDVMAELKTFWDDPGMPISTDLSGDANPSSGSDPNAEGGDEHGNGLVPAWDDPPVSTLTSKSESPNSVSGLPSLPNRFEPNVTPPDPPDLKDRNPGTIDER